jgi:hypothetical protein
MLPSGCQPITAAIVRHSHSDIHAGVRTQAHCSPEAELNGKTHALLVSCRGRTEETTRIPRSNDFSVAVAWCWDRIHSDL